ncbi:MAG TPA: c-type cytochrome [Nevskiaceae bacterium]
MRDLSDAAFVRRFSRVMMGLGVIIAAALITAAVMSIGSDRHPELAQAQLLQRLAPVGSAATSAQAVVVAVADKGSHSAPKSGEQIVEQVCAACHGSGMLGAPKIGDNAAWEARFKSQGGRSGLLKHAIAGLGSMPPRGGDSGLSDDEMKGAIAYMLSKSGISQ